MVSGERWAVGSALTTTTFAAAILGAVGVGAGLAVYALASESAFQGVGRLTVLTALCSVPFALRCQYVSNIAIACRRYPSAALVVTVGAAASLFAVVALAGLFGVLGGACGLLVASIVASAAAFAVARRLSTEVSNALDVRRLGLAASFGWKPYAANLLGLIVYRFDLFVLNASGGARAVGYYGAGIAFASVSTLGADAVSAILFPRVSALASSSEADDSELVATETRALRQATLALVVATVASGALVITVLEPALGAPFAPARTVGLILLPGCAALGLAGAFYAALAGRGRPRFALTAGVLLAPLSVGLYLVLIPPFGAVGAALGSTIAYCTSAALAGLFLQQASGYPTLPRLVPTRREFDDYAALLGHLRGARKDPRRRLR